MTFDYRGQRDRIFGITRDANGKIMNIAEQSATMSERVVLLALVEYAPNIEPSTEALAKMCGCTDERSIRRLLRSCEAKGLLKVERRGGKRSRYTITCDPGLIVPPDSFQPRTLSPPTPDAESSPPRTLSPPKQTTKADKEADKFLCAQDAQPKTNSTRTRKPKQERPAKWRRVPSSWQPNDAHEAIARGRGLSFSMQLEAFRDHEFAQPKSDPDAAFRNWLRRAFEPRGRSVHEPKQPEGGQYKLPVVHRSSSPTERNPNWTEPPPELANVFKPKRALPSPVTNPQELAELTKWADTPLPAAGSPKA